MFQASKEFQHGFLRRTEIPTEVDLALSTSGFSCCEVVVAFPVAGDAY